MHVHGLNKRCGLPPPGRPGCAFAKIAKTINRCVSFAGDGRRIGKAPRRGNAVACKSFRYSSVSLLTRSSCVSATCKPHSLHGLIHFDIVAGWNEKSNRCLARGKVETPAMKKAAVRLWEDAGARGSCGNVIRDEWASPCQARGLARAGFTRTGSTAQHHRRDGRCGGTSGRLVPEKLTFRRSASGFRGILLLLFKRRSQRLEFVAIEGRASAHV